MHEWGGWGDTTARLVKACWGSTCSQKPPPRLGWRFPGQFDSLFLCDRTWVGGALLKGPVRVILVTDGDKVARRAMEESCRQLGLRCISASAGNPSPFTGPELVQLIQQAVGDPVLVMVDDKGNPGRGAGESALAYLCKHPDLRILGAIAVASNTRRTKGVKVDLSVTRDGAVVHGPVDKDGRPVRREALLQGDTVDVLRELNLPVVVGVGDPGKMEGADGEEAGYAVTTRAIREVLSRSLGE